MGATALILLHGSTTAVFVLLPIFLLIEGLGAIFGAQRI